MVLHLPLPIWQQLQCYVESCLPNEVTGIGAIRIIDPDTVEVTEIFLPAQSVDAAYSQFDNGELGRIISKFVGNNPACAGLFPSLLEIIQHVLAIYAFVGTHMDIAKSSGPESIKPTSTVGREIMSSIW